MQIEQSVPMGFRQSIYNDSVKILEALYYQQEKPSSVQVQTLRDAWEVSKRGNLLLNALAEVDLYYAEEIPTIINLPGFLTTRERWHTQRAREVTVYRGCSVDELNNKAYGLSWTTDKEVAVWFASRCKNPIVVTAKSRIDAWLDTSESECIVVWMNHDNLIEIEVASSETQKINWNKRKSITPYAKSS